MKPANYFYQALLTLNSCPMFPYQNVDLHRMPVAQRVHLPIPAEGIIQEIVDDAVAGEGETTTVDPALARLPASSLRGTFAKAYDLLVEIVHETGWDMLLKYRSKVFIMEEEYRSLKTETSSLKKLNNHSRADSDASNVAVNGRESSADVDDEEGLPNIVKPESSVDAELVKGSEDGHHTTSAAASAKDDKSSTTFRSKRLCERWLDNLFMVMYEDMRVYTLWRAESAHYKAQQLAYKKSLREWEILGALAVRMRHTEEAAEAYNLALDIRFSAKALKGLMEIYVEKKEPINVLHAAIKLTSYDHRWFKEFSPLLIKAMQGLVQEEGSQKLRNMIQGSDYSASVAEMMDVYFDIAKQFHWPGYEEDDDGR